MLSRLFMIFISLLALVAVVLMLLRYVHNRDIGMRWESLRVPASGEVFDPASIATLPAPARRYLHHAIAPGTPLAGYAELTMDGTLALLPGAKPQPMRARQILATHGLIWQAEAGQGLFRISGDDSYVNGEGMMRWYFWGLVPVISANGPDLSRSAAGRVALELPSWLPSALLPHPDVQWEALDEQRVRVRFSLHGEPFAPLLTIDADGRLTQVEMQRWDTRGPEGKPGYIPWLAELSEEETFGGYTIPTRVRGITRAGTNKANPFFNAKLRQASFH